MEEKSYQTLEDKRGELVELPLESLVVSEMNVRCAFVDQEHVRTLSAMMKEYGFQKERAIRVNVILDASGKVLYRRVIAGAHRYYAAKHAGLTNIYCHLYYNLSEEEECLLDTIDNKIDEKRKQVHFLDEAEHYRFLRDVKGWSVRQIAQNKNISRSTVSWRLKIADLPQEVRELIRGVHTVDTLVEGHFREICKLSNPAYMTMIIKEIIARGQEEEAEEGPETRGAMKQKEVAQRVAELVALEVRDSNLQLSPLFNSSESLAKKESDVTPCNSPQHEVASTSLALGACDAPQQNKPLTHLTNSPTALLHPSFASSSLETTDTPGGEALLPEPLPLQPEEQAPSSELNHDDSECSSYCYRSEESATWSTDEMPFDVLPRWLKFSSLQRQYRSLWPLLQALIGYALRFRSNASSSGNGAFFLGSPDYTTPEQEEYLAQATGVGVRTVRRHLGLLEQAGFLKILPPKRGRAPLFHLQWGRLKQVYDKEASSIPYREGGLKDLPDGFTGLIQPTPIHDLWFRNGERKKGTDYALRDVRRELAQLGIKPSKIHQLLQTYAVEHLALRLDELPRHQERYARQNKTIHNILGFFLQSLDTRFPI